MAIHVHRRISATLLENSLRQRTTDQVERPHPDPVRPRVADHYDVTVVRRYMRIVPEKVVALSQRLLPVVAIGEVRYPHLAQAFGEGYHVLLQVAFVVAA